MLRLRPQDHLRFAGVACLGVGVVLGCGSSTDDGRDAGADASTQPDAQLTSPVPAAAPELGSCPVGWSEVAADPLICEPWPADARPTCGSNDGLFSTGCEPLAVCPAGDFPDVPESADVRYVRPGADGDGSMMSPFGTIADALFGAASGTTIVLGKGVFNERVRLSAGIALVGACPGETVIRTDEVGSSPFDSVIEVLGRGSVLRDLRVESAARSGVLIREAAELHDVIVDGVANVGVIVNEGAELSGSRIVVRGTRRLSDFSYALAFGDGSRGTLSDASLTDNAGSGLSALGATVTLQRAVIAGTGSSQRFDPLWGRGLEVLDGSQFICRECIVEDCRSRAVYLEGMGASASFERSLLRSSAPTSEDGAGRGLVAFEGTHLQLRRTALDGFRQVAANIRGAGTEALLEDVVLRGLPIELGHNSYPILVREGAHAMLRRVEVASYAQVALAVAGLDTLLDAEDVRVRDAQGSADGEFGTGVQVADGATLNAVRLTVERARMQGVVVGGDRPTQASLQDLIVDDTRAARCYESGACEEGYGDAVVSIDNASIVVDRFEVSRAFRVGLHIVLGEIQATHGLVRNNEIGAAVQAPGFDISNINMSVLYRDNTRALDRGSNLPVATPQIEL